VEPQSLAYYAYSRNNPLNFTDRSGEYSCAASVWTRNLAQLSRGYPALCLKSYRIADLWFAQAGRTSALGVLISLFSANDFPGGDGPHAAPLRKADRTPAAERLEFILDYTEDGKLGTPFGKNFNDTGFNPQFQDPWKGESDNQVGHFLTAVALGYDAPKYVRALPTKVFLSTESPSINSLSDDEVALRLIVGHELRPDVPKSEQLNVLKVIGSINQWC
jgi:hypothetical protein